MLADDSGMPAKAATSFCNRSEAAWMKPNRLLSRRRAGRDVSSGASPPSTHLVHGSYQIVQGIGVQPDGAIVLNCRTVNGPGRLEAWFTRLWKQSLHD